MRLHLVLGTAGVVTAQILRMRKLRLTGRWSLVKVTQASSDGQYSNRHWPLTGNKAWGWWAGLEGLLTPAPPPGDSTEEGRKAGTILLIYGSGVVNHTIWMPHACLVRAPNPAVSTAGRDKGEARQISSFGAVCKAVCGSQSLEVPPSHHPSLHQRPPTRGLVSLLASERRDECPDSVQREGSGYSHQNGKG